MSRPPCAAAGSCAAIMRRGISISRRNGKTTPAPSRSWNGATRAGTSRAARAGAGPIGGPTFQARSSVDLQPLLGSFGLGAILQDATFHSPPQIEASGSATIGAAEKKFELVGKFAVEKFSWRAIDFEGATCDFAWDGARTMLRDIRLRHRSGQLNADLYDAPDDFRLNLDSSLVPSAFEPLLPEKARPFSARVGLAALAEHSSQPARHEPRSGELARRGHARPRADRVSAASG